MFRTWAGIQTLVSTSQPVFGTAMNGAGAMLLDQHTHNTNPASQDSLTVLPVTTTIGFLKNDRVLVGPRTQAVSAMDQGTVFAINPGVSITVQKLTRNHVSGELVILNEDVAHVAIVPVVGNAGVLYIGNAYTVAIGDPSTYDMIPPPAAPAQPTYWHNPPNLGGGDGYKTSEYWVSGTAGDKFLPTITVL